MKFCANLEKNLQILCILMAHANTILIVQVVLVNWHMVRLCCELMSGGVLTSEYCLVQGLSAQ